MNPDNLPSLTSGPPTRPARIDAATVRRHPIACDPRAMAALLGLDAKPLGSGMQARCVWHDDRSPSMNLRRGPDGTLQVKCFSCDEGGHVFDLVAQVHGLDHRRDFGRVLALTAELVGDSPGRLYRDASEWERAKANRDAATRAGHLAAAKTASRVWHSAQPVDVHPYLARKGIGPNGARQDCGHLVVPFVDGDMNIWTLERIHADGTKRFLPGGKLAGHFALIGFKRHPKAVVVCEGWATGASVHEATGFSVAVAGSSTNLMAVAKEVRSRWPNRLVIAADDDPKPDGRNPGRQAAEEAALTVGGAVVLPDFGATRPEGASDFNDMARLLGPDAVRAAFAKVLP